MDRLVAYVDGELSPDAREAFEAELAADATLRAELAALQRADGVLGQLSSPTPSAGFEDRLRAGLAPTLAEVLGTPTGVDVGAGAESDAAVAAGRSTDATPGHAVHGPGADAALEDELAARRARRADGSRGAPRWARLTASAAAGVAILAGGGLVLSGALTGSDDDAFPDAGTMDAADQADDEGAAMTLRAGPVGPEIVTDGRDVDDERIDALLAGGVVGELVELGVDPLRGDELATDFQSQLGLGPTPESGPADGDEAQADDPAADVEESAPADDAGTAADDDPIARCVAEVTRDAPSAIPAYVELATYQDTEVVVVGLVTVDPATGAYTRAEAWVLDRATCQTLRFSQRS